MFPGHEYRIRSRIASFVISRTGGTPFSPCFERKCSARRGMSEIRSRKGGRVSFTMFNR